MRILTIAMTGALVMSACGDDTASDTTDAPATSIATLPSTTVAETTTVESTTTEPTTPGSSANTTGVDSDFADRPFNVFVPSGYNDATAAPLVILLHGYGAFGDLQEMYFKLEPEAEARGFLYVRPDGLIDARNSGYWNATPACCDQTQATDDSGYLLHIIDEVSATYNVDQSRVYLVGHSNGGFMSYRMACEHADRIAAIVSLAGATFLDTADCSPSEPVNVLQVHGTRDNTIEYEGGSTPLGPFPSAETTVATWSAYNGCAPATNPLADRDIEASIAGAETAVIEFADCPVDGAVELWTIENGSHIPALASTWAADIVDWLYAHPNAS